MLDSPPVGRRRFLAFASSLAGALTGGLLLGPLLGCSSARDEAELRSHFVDAVRALLDGPRVVPPAFSTPPMDRGQALEILIGDLGHDQIRGLLEGPERLRAHLDRRGRADFAAERMTYVEGWMLAETDVAVAVLLNP